MIEGRIYRDPETKEWLVKIRSITYTLQADYTLEAVKKWRDDEIAYWKKKERDDAEFVNRVARAQLIEE